jgi:endonuclease-3 related protein
MAIDGLCGRGLLNPTAIVAASATDLGNTIRPSGYYNQKTKKLKTFSRYLLSRSDRQNPERNELLSLWGIGPETADSILLYAYKEPFFVVDAYTTRVALRLGLIKEETDYEAARSLFMTGLPNDHELFNEFHALFVRHAKEHCRKSPVCESCCLCDICPGAPG